MEGIQPGQCPSESFSVLQQYARLRELYDKHGADIEARWTSMKEGLRRQYLKAAFPRIPDTPVYQWALENPEEKKTERLAPRVNCEQLLPGNSMLLFVQSCATPPPCDFLYSDLDNTQVIPGACDWVIVGSDEEFCMVFLDEDQEGEYGKIARSEDHADQFVLPATIGNQGLVIQAHYYPGLVRLCEKLAKFADNRANVDLEPETLATRPSWSMSYQSAIVADGWLSLSELSRRAPLRAPGHLDLHGIQELVSERVSDRLDHIAQLWTDRFYFFAQCDSLALLLVAYYENEVQTSPQDTRKYTRTAAGDAIHISAVWQTIAETLDCIVEIDAAGSMFEEEDCHQTLKEPLWALFSKLQTDVEQAVLMVVRKHKLAASGFEAYDRLHNPKTPIATRHPKFKIYTERLKRTLACLTTGI